MSGRSRVYTDPAYFEFIRNRGPVVGFQSKALWREFNERFGLNRSFQSFRQFADRVGTGGLELPAAEPTSLNDVVQHRNDQLKEQQRERLLRELLEKEASMTRLIAAIESVVPQVPKAEIPRWPEPPPVSEGRPQSAILLLSDIHYGEEIRAGEIGGINAYNRLIFQERKDAYVRGVRSIIRHHQSAHPVRELRIFDLGDGVDGDMIFRSQRLHQDLDLMQQVFGLVEEKAEIILSFLDLVDTVTVECVPGNHGRVGPKGDNKSYVNWDYVVARTLAYKLAQFSDRVKVVAPESFFHITEVEGHTWLLWHGDDVKAWQGIPWYGIQRAIGNWVQIFNATGQRFEYAAIGHFHTDAKVDITAGEVFVNGSWVGTNEYALRLRALGQPKQTLMFCHPRYGVTARYPVLLDRDETATAA